jgi:hypothetical protein
VLLDVDTSIGLPKKQDKTENALWVIIIFPDPDDLAGNWRSETANTPSFLTIPAFPLLRAIITKISENHANLVI